MDKSGEGEFNAGLRARQLLVSCKIARGREAEFREKILASELADPEEALGLAVGLMRSMRAVYVADLARVQGVETMDTKGFPEELIIRLDVRRPEVRKITGELSTAEIARIDMAFERAENGNFTHFKQIIRAAADIAGRKVEAEGVETSEPQLEYANKLRHVDDMIPDVGPPLQLAFE